MYVQVHMDVHIYEVLLILINIKKQPKTNKIMLGLIENSDRKIIQTC